MIKFSTESTARHSRTQTNNWARIKAFVRQLEQKPRRKVLIQAENLRFYMSALLTSHFLICRLESWVFYEHLMCDLIARRNENFHFSENFCQMKIVFGGNRFVFIPNGGEQSCVPTFVCLTTLNETLKTFSQTHSSDV